MKAWILAARPRTLILAVACILPGVFLAMAAGLFRPIVALLCLLTALCLQVLSNFANDYGDSRHGADSSQRVGPKRAVQQGLITPVAMWRAVLGSAAAAALCGLLLLWVAAGTNGLYIFFAFALLGGGAIWAAVAYTASAKPYGYQGLGDVMVLVFFGWAAVLGSYVLQTWQSIIWQNSLPVLLPATAFGLLAVGVLNINNIRDIDSDRAAGKRSIPVRLGAAHARWYHVSLLAGAWLFNLLYLLGQGHRLGAGLWLLAAVLLGLNGQAVWVRKTPAELDPLLKQLSFITLMCSLLFGLALYL
jgi:1,4-dihydroxy-2-naphthoate octaprenyltransferase